MKMEEIKALIDNSPYKDKLLNSEEGKSILPFLMFLFLDKEEMEKLKEEHYCER